MEASEVQQPLTNDLANLMKMILMRNNSIFGEDHYLQLHGTAMGTNMAPSFANLFMGRLETHLLEVAAQKPTIWWWYIDDVFTCWPHSEGYLNQFLEQLNNVHSSIKFTAKWFYRCVLFLDVNVSLDSEG